MHGQMDYVLAFIKTFYSILKKIVDKNKKTWLEKLPVTLWAYRITIRIVM